MPRHLLLPQPGLDRTLVAAALREGGLNPVADSRSASETPSRWTDAAAPTPSVVEYWEDRTLGQRRIYTFGPRAAELRDWCAAHWPCWSPAEAVAQAAAAETSADKVATLAPLVAVLEEDAASEALAVLQTRLDDAVLAVRRAALLVAASVPAGAGLVQAMVGDPLLGAVARSYLTAGTLGESGGSTAFDLNDPAAVHERAVAARQTGDLIGAARLVERALELAPLASAAYLLRAELSAADGRLWPALIDVTTALAIARRQGVHLAAMQELQTSLRAQLLAAPTPPTAAVEMQAVAGLTLLLGHRRLHEVEEIAEALLPLPGRAALWWLTIGLARWERGRPERAIAALEAALTDEPNLAAARFLLGECRRALGDIEGALSDFAALDPVAGERPARPSLLAAYADELLGTQSPWEAREHAFDRVQLLREHDRAVEALAVLTELLRREPAAADALLAQGILFGELGQPAAALIVLDQALAALRPAERLLAEEDPLGTLQHHRAAALFALGDKEGAAAAHDLAQRLGAEPAAPRATDPERRALSESAAAYAALRRLAQQGFQADLGTDSAAPELNQNTEGTLDAATLGAALREQVAELLVAALGALDGQADATARRALIHRARRGLAALTELAPRLVSASAAAVETILDATAHALGIASKP